MILQIYSIYDDKAGAHMLPFFMQNDLVAVRAFRNLCSDKEHQVGQNPPDYSLKKLGSYDDNTGEIEPVYETIAEGRFSVKLDEVV